MRSYLGLLALLLPACGPAGGGSPADSPSAEGGAEDAALPGEGGIAPSADAGPGAAPDAAVDASTDASHADASLDAGHTDASKPHDAAPEAPTCSKHLTVLFSVGTGAGSLASHATGCWDVLDADGAANKSFRKCSTSNYAVGNPSAPNYAFDDSNPNAPLAQDQSFLQQCAAGATGEGFEYLAYRGSWRLLFPANHLKAFFAELHAGDSDVDDNWPGAYVGNAQLAKHTVYPMINIGPVGVASPEGRIKTDGLAICKTIADGGYFGVYVGAWNQPMPDDDPRIVALADALDACTK